MKRTSFIARQSESLTNYCGPMQAQALLAAHGSTIPFRELYPSALHRWTDSFLPWDMSNALNRRGISARLRLWSKKSIASRAIAALNSDKVIVLVIRSPKSNCLHWISLWNFNPTKQTFNTYDSQDETVKGEYGNTEYSVGMLLKSICWPVTFVVEVGV